MSEPTPIPGFPDYGATRDGQIWSRRKGDWKPLALSPNGKDGYLKVKLFNKTNVPITRRVHLLVAITFIGPRPSYNHECNHIDLDKTNCSVKNLEWITKIENQLHYWRNRQWTYHGKAEAQMCAMLESVMRATRHRKEFKNSKLPNASYVLTATDVKSIRRSWVRSKSGIDGASRSPRPNSLTSLGRRFGVSKQTVWCVVHRLKWRHVAL
jgi:hypothetical protein